MRRILSLIQPKPVLFACLLGVVVGVLISEVSLLLRRETPIAATPVAMPPHLKDREALWPVCPLEEAPASARSDPTIGPCPSFLPAKELTRFPLPDAAAHARFWERIRSPSTLDEESQLHCYQPTDEQLVNLEEARSLIISSHFPDEFWHREMILNAVDLLDTDELFFCVNVLNSEIGEVNGQYVTSHNTIVLSFEIMSGPTDHLAAVLLHELTHYEYQMTLADITNLDWTDVSRIISRCEDIRSVSHVSTETLAYMNEALWMDANHVMTSDASELSVREGRVAAARGDLRARAIFASDMVFEQLMHEGLPLLFAADASSDDENVDRRRAIQNACGPFVRVTDGRYDYVLPTDVAPELLEEIYELGEIEPEELEWLQYMGLADHFSPLGSGPFNPEYFHDYVLGLGD